MQQESETLRSAGKKIGLVPTMGYLHAGHMRLVEQAKRMSDLVIVSIFVNPAQFAPNEDFSRYPRDFERDKSLLSKAQVDVVFNPGMPDMYVSNFGTYIEELEASRVLEGKFRPTHFRGVTTVVAKLLNICKPHIAIFGQKDAQQVFIVRKMIRDLNFDTTVIVVPIVREEDGLAMSSRNVYLSPQERTNAIVLHQSLEFAEAQIRNGERDVRRLQSAMEQLIRSKGSPAIDYVAFIDPQSFHEIEKISSASVLIALAVRFGTTRLIDNALVSVG